MMLCMKQLIKKIYLFLFCFLILISSVFSLENLQNNNDEVFSLSISIPYESEKLVREHLPWRWNSAFQVWVPDGEKKETTIWILLRKKSNDLKESFFYDVWCWRAYRSSLSGYADDLSAKINDPCLMTLRLTADEGSPGWCLLSSPTQPIDMNHPVRYIKTSPCGGRGDVKVTDFYDNRRNVLILRFSRERDTHDSGDFVLGDDIEYAVFCCPASEISLAESKFTKAVFQKEKCP